MSGLEAFGLACNVMTVITFALETAKICRNIHETGSSDKNLQENTEDIERVLNDVQHLLRQRPMTPTVAEMNLRDLATKCMKSNEAIQKEMKDISPKDSTLRATIGSTVKSLMRRSHINKLMSQLEVARQTMESALIVQILNECMKSGALNRDTYTILNQQQKEFLANFEQFQRVFVEFEAARETQTYETLLNSLRYENMNDRKNSILQRYHNTFEWVFEDADRSGDNFENANTPNIKTTEIVNVQPGHETDTEYLHNRPDLVPWLQEDTNCLYWVNGKPGSGKSTFMKFIEQDQRTKKALKNWHAQFNIISHFLWKPGTDNQQSLRGLLCSLLHQVLTNERSIAIQLLTETPILPRKRAVTDWDIHDLTELLFRAFDISSYANLILLDGLDELSEPQGGFEKLFYLLNQFMKADRVKLCVSSRPEHRFTVEFATNPTIRMQDLTCSDIYSYTRDFLRSLQLGSEDELFEKILREILRKANGVFIWVYLVLKDIKTGINEYAENSSWEDIYCRIVKLPADLMVLYKDMWSRLPDTNEKYIKKAARYFQCTRMLGDWSSVAILSLVANEQRLEALAVPDESPCVDDLVDICKATFKTLPSVSAGLLELTEDYDYAPSYEFQSVSELEVFECDKAHVRFIHRTAVDFLDSAEGQELFAKYTLKPADLLLLLIKADITISSATRYRLLPLHDTFMIIASEHRKSLSPFTGHFDLSLVHQSALNESRELIRPPYSISHQNFFLFQATYYKFYRYVDKWLASSEGDDSLASIYTVIGACDTAWGSSKPSITHPPRYKLIRDQLKAYLSHEIESPGRPVARATTSELMLAWRCFLLHEMSNQRHIGVVDTNKAIIKEILEIFIKAGVMAETSKSRYLIAAQSTKLEVVKADKQSKFGHKFATIYHEDSEPAIYAEVNDAFLLQRLWSMNPLTSELISSQGKGAFMQPILASKCNERVDGLDFFKLVADEEDQEFSKDWIFDRNLCFDERLFVEKLPRFIQGEDLGEFSHAVDALEQIGYDLPAVNREYDCLHTWV